MQLKTTAQWIISLAVFLSIVPLMIYFAFPLFIVGVILYWATDDDIVNKISWTILPILIAIGLIYVIYINPNILSP